MRRWAEKCHSVNFLRNQFSLCVYNCTWACNLVASLSTFMGDNKQKIRALRYRVAWISHECLFRHSTSANRKITRWNEKCRKLCAKSHFCLEIHRNQRQTNNYWLHAAEKAQLCNYCEIFQYNWLIHLYSLRTTKTKCKNELY